MYKQSTQQTLDFIKQVEDYINSSAYKSQITWQDISSNNSPYKHGDQTLQDWIDGLLKSFELIKENIVVYDRGSYDQRNAISASYLANLVGWIQNPIWNYTNIIQYSNNIFSSLFNLGIGLKLDLPDSKEVKKLMKELSWAKDILSKTSLIDSLVNELSIIKESSGKLDQAKELLETLEKTKNIKEIDEFIENWKNKITELTKQADQLLWKASDVIISRHFSDTAEKYRKEVEGETTDWRSGSWNNYFFASLIFFILNIVLIIILRENLSVSMWSDLMKIIANGLIRLTCLTPWILLLWFTLQNRNHKDKLKETYEFRSVTTKTILWHIETLRVNWISWDKLNDFIVHAFTNIYTEPDFSKKPKEENGLLNTDKFSKFVDTFEKLKWNKD